MGKMICGCGYEEHNPEIVGGKGHYLGEGNCCRYLLSEEEEPTILHTIKGKKQWRLPSGIVTDYTLREQRLYSQHSNGKWSRPKSKSSINSL